MKVISICLVLVLILLSGSESNLGSQRSPQTPSISVSVGEPELVMDYSTESCPRAGGYDLPDVQTRAVRSPIDESIILISGNAPDNYTMRGASFDNLIRNCRAILISGDSPYAHTFDNQEWITSVYREGEVIHALVHNEYHDPIATTCRVGDTSPSNPCWYNGISYAVSTDGGTTFLQSAAPESVVAALPTPWQAPVQSSRRSSPNPHGYFSPSNIILGPEGYYYTLFMAIPDPDEPAFRGTCVIRTDNLNDPSSWRAWDGSDFALTIGSPYDELGNPSPTGLPPCTFVSRSQIGTLHGSLTYNEFLQRYLLVGSGVYVINGAQICGTYFSLSEDLIEWTPAQLIMSGLLPHPPCTSGSPNGSIIYPSLIDHQDSSLNFEITGQTPHLYYVLWNQGLDRDLWRVPITFESE